jgi:hypothetical protein
MKTKEIILVSATVLAGISSVVSAFMTIVLFINPMFGENPRTIFHYLFLIDDEQNFWGLFFLISFVALYVLAISLKNLYLDSKLFKKIN